MFLANDLERLPDADLFGSRCDGVRMKDGGEDRLATWDHPLPGFGKGTGVEHLRWYVRPRCGKVERYV